MMVNTPPSTSRRKTAAGTGPTPRFDKLMYAAEQQVYWWIQLAFANLQVM
jgi:hypothetical protein